MCLRTIHKLLYEFNNVRYVHYNNIYTHTTKVIFCTHWCRIPMYDDIYNIFLMYIYTLPIFLYVLVSSIDLCTFVIWYNRNTKKISLTYGVTIIYDHGHKHLMTNINNVLYLFVMVRIYFL